ncbi:MAG TPA: SOS response-associated peptidase [Opitutus sp.]|nr:SOS response-associated peptidase [Opitutus sp.]
MCTRYLLMEEHYRAVLARLGIALPGAFVTRYNIAPGTAIPAIRRVPTDATRREAVALRWGFVPSWSEQDEGTRLVNARAESIATRPMFRDAYRKRRCVVPASGFYEWQPVGRVKQPWLFRRRDEQPFGLAGLWDRWRRPDGGMLETCAVLTTEPNALMRPIHTRMPVLLTAEQCETWLDAPDPAALEPLLQPAPADAWSAVAVSTRVNNVRVDDPSVLAPAAADRGGDIELLPGFE